MFFLAENCIQCLPHFDFGRTGRIGHSRPPVEYLFENIISGTNEEHTRRMVCNIAGLSSDERDSIVILYGPKESGKNKLKELILTNVMEIFKKYVAEGAIDQGDLKLRLMIKEYDIKVSELWLKKDTYVEQIDSLINAIVNDYQNTNKEKKFLKERVQGLASKFAFFELSQIVEHEHQIETTLLDTQTEKVAGCYIITCNKLMKLPYKSKTKSNLVTKILQEAMKGCQDTPLEIPFRR